MTLLVVYGMPEFVCLVSPKMNDFSFILLPSSTLCIMMIFSLKKMTVK